MKYKEILLFARTLRKNQTEAEKIFWHHARGRKIMNKKFLRQKIIQHSEILGHKYYFIPDFYCAEKQLIIEIDGQVHNHQMEYDKIRENTLKSMNYKIVRFSNEEVINNWEYVESRLMEVLN